MKKLFFSCLIFILFQTSSFAQDAGLMPNFGGRGCTHMEWPAYLINSNYVVYEDCLTRKIIHPDLATFSIPSRVQQSGIAVDKNGIWFRGEFIKTDTAGFTLVGRNNEYPEQWLWKTAHKVFNNSTELHGIDAATFSPQECFNGAYFKDKNFIYFFDRKIAGSDGSTINISCSGLCYDKKNVYVNGKIMYFGKEKLQPVNEIFSRTSKAVIHDNKVFEGLDAATIKPLSAGYTMDKKSVYYETERSPISPKDFRNVKVWQQANSRYVSDGKHIYAAADYLEADLDAPSFGMLSVGDYFFDKKGIYFRMWLEKENRVINYRIPFDYDGPVNSGNSSITSNGIFITYKHQVWNVITKEFFKNVADSQLVLLKTNKLYLTKTYDSQTDPVEDLGGGFTKQSGKIFFKRKLIDADAATFEYLLYNHAKDKDHVYGTDYFKDSVYVIPGIDPKAAKAKWGLFVGDENGLYFMGKQMIAGRNIELLSTFCGYRPGCGLDKHPSNNYYFFRSDKGYWLFDTQGPGSVKFLGETFDPHWHKAFENFILPDK